MRKTPPPRYQKLAIGLSYLIVHMSTISQWCLPLVGAGAEQNCVDSLAFDTLVPKSILQRYVSLLMDHRRIILCGSSGTGKTHMARRFAEHLIIRCELLDLT